MRKIAVLRATAQCPLREALAMLHATEAFTRWLRGLKDRSAQAVIVEHLQRVARGFEGIAKAIRLDGML